MKQKLFTAFSTIMLFIPWTIFALRSFDWALESPAAEISIACYAVFMIFSGIFTIAAYAKAAVRHMLMKICVVINSMYAAAGLMALVMMVFQAVSG